jgi:hypothetical protein
LAESDVKIVEIKRRPPKKHTVSRTVVLQANFKLVFLSVLVITVAAIAAAILLAGVWPSPTANQQAVFEGVGFTWKAGVGAIFGLLGGKIT